MFGKVVGTIGFGFSTLEESFTATNALVFKAVQTNSSPFGNIAFPDNFSGFSTNPVKRVKLPLIVSDGLINSETQFLEIEKVLFTFLASAVVISDFAASAVPSIFHL